MRENVFKRNLSQQNKKNNGKKTIVEHDLNKKANKNSVTARDLKNTCL